MNKPSEVLPISTHYLIELYAGGKSVYSMSRMFGVDRGVVRRRLTEAGIILRNRSDAQSVRNSKLTAEERTANIRAAHAARRGAKDTWATLALRAKAIERSLSKIGISELMFAKLLAERGILSEAQKAVGKYNIDLACFPIAVEVHRNGSHPLRLERNRKRLMYLRKRGWCVLFVWFNPWKNSEILPIHADEAVTLIKLARRNPPEWGKYRMIRCHRNG